MKCDECIHNEVCGYQKEYREKFEELKLNDQNNSIFKITMECEYFDGGVNKEIEYIPIYSQLPYWDKPYVSPWEQPSITWTKDITVTGL